MRTIILIMFLSLLQGLSSQTIISDKAVWSFKWYNFAGDLDDEEVPIDTLYTIQKFPKKNDWKIFFDISKTVVATEIHYDSIKKIITTKNYKRNGELIQEFYASYKDKKSCNPASARLKCFKYLKIYNGDGLICEMKGQVQVITVRYRNYINNKYFDQTMYFSEVDSWRDDYLGPDVWKYYQNGNIKSMCKTIREDHETETLLFLKCKNFDTNGCIILDK